MNATYKRRPKRRSRRITRKQVSIQRNFKTNTQLVKANTVTRIYLDDAGKYGIDVPSTTYFNLAAMLATSPEYTSRAQQYSYYKISGMKFTLTRMWIDPLSTATPYQNLTFGSGMEMISLNFYPSLVSSAVGAPIQNSDSTWIVSPFISGPVSHSIFFPAKFTQGPNAQGLGVWNACNQSNNISGMLACYNTGFNIKALATTAVSIWDLRIEISLAFCNNTGA